MVFTAPHLPPRVCLRRVGSTWPSPASRRLAMEVLPAVCQPVLPEAVAPSPAASPAAPASSKKHEREVAEVLCAFCHEGEDSDDPDEDPLIPIETGRAKQHHAHENCIWWCPDVWQAPLTAALSHRHPHCRPRLPSPSPPASVPASPYPRPHLRLRPYFLLHPRPHLHPTPGRTRTSSGRTSVSH